MIEVAVWLNMLSKSRNHVSLFVPDYKRLTRLCPVHIHRVITNNDGDPRLYIIDRDKAIESLKTIYGFLTKKEATDVLQEQDDGVNI